MDDISIIGIIVAALAFFFLGAVWYTFLFGRAWRGEVGVTEEQAATPNPMLFVWSIAVALVLAVTLALLIRSGGTGYGFKVGAGTGIGIGAAVIAQNCVYESRSLRFFGINAGYVAVGLSLMGVIVGAFQAG